MSEELTVKFNVHFSRSRHGRKDARLGAAPAAENMPVVPRIARLMALAIRFDELIRNGTVQSYAELARLGHVTRARITQIMNLLNLAPDIQEDIVRLVIPPSRRITICERDLRPIATIYEWERQRSQWGTLFEKSVH